MKLSHSILVLAMLLCVSQLCEGGFVPVLRRTVRITNKLDGNLLFDVHCKSKDDDLGVHNLEQGKSYEFRFKRKFLINVTLFYCSFRWVSDECHWFDIYNDKDEKTSDCETCVWEIKQAGPCRLQDEQRGSYICLPWK